MIIELPHNLRQPSLFETKEQPPAADKPKFVRWFFESVPDDVSLCPGQRWRFAVKVATSGEFERLYFAPQLRLKTILEDSGLDWGIDEKGFLACWRRVEGMISGALCRSWGDAR